MACLPQRLDALTAADGRRDRATLNNIARAIREDGLLPRGTTGRGAPRMNTRNAADLLIAVVLPVPRGEAADAARQFGTLRRRPHGMDRLSDWRLQLAEAPTFVEALTVLIEQAPAIGDTVVQWIDDACPGLPTPERYKLLTPRITIGFVTPLRAYITLQFNQGDGGCKGFHLDYDWNVNPAWKSHRHATLQSDWEIETRVHFGTILRLHDALADVAMDGEAVA
jgi:hypothetical protein